MRRILGAVLAVGLAVAAGGAVAWAECDNSPSGGSPTLEQRIDDVLRDTTPGKVSSSRQYHKAGGWAQATRDFDYLRAGQPVRTDARRPGLRMAQLPERVMLVVRTESKQGHPTVEIQRRGQAVVKVRYS